MNVRLLFSLAKSHREWEAQYIEATKPLDLVPPLAYAIT